MYALKITSPARSGAQVEDQGRLQPRKLERNFSAGYSFFDDRERIVDRGDALADDFLAAVYEA
jgi:hypothetical protein